MKERLIQSHRKPHLRRSPDQGNRYRFVSLRSPCNATHYRLDTLRSPIMETPARWALVKRRCPPPFRQALSLRGLRQAEPTWSFIADHEHSSLARLAALAKHEDSSPPRSMRARADHGGAIVSAAILKYSSPLLLIHPFLLASLAWQSLHSDGQRQIPTPWLLLARQFSACPQTHNFKDMFRKLSWSLVLDRRSPSAWPLPFVGGQDQ